MVNAKGQKGSGKEEEVFGVNREPFKDRLKVTG